jgi:hypothetical protein
VKHSEQMAVWAQYSGQWSRVGPLLEPSPEDTALTLSALRPVFDANYELCRIAVLGVTPELVQLPWPQTVTLDAFDQSADMIAKVWKPNPGVPSSVHEADWRALPLAAVSGASEAVADIYPDV